MSEDGQKRVFATVCNSQRLFGSLLFIDIDNDANPAIGFFIRPEGWCVNSIYPARSDGAEIDFELQPDRLL